MKIAIVKYNGGNVRSVQLALNRLGYDSVITDDRTLIRQADRVIFPGQGEAKSALEYLRQRELEGVLKELKQPTLGICLGHQLFCNHLEEGDSVGLQFIDANVKRFAIERKVPHIGWTKISHNGDKLFDGVSQYSYFYFIHSYYVPRGDYEIGWASYGEEFCAALRKDNFIGVQFHPEKSGKTGEVVLQNFINGCI